MVASSCGQPETVTLLLKHRAQVDLADVVRNRVNTCSYAQSGMCAHTRLL